jgi:hypothetical protein
VAWRTERDAERCQCKHSWTGQSAPPENRRIEYTEGGCQNPDGDSNGPWCFVQARARYAPLPVRMHTVYLGVESYRAGSVQDQRCGNVESGPSAWINCVNHCHAGRGIGSVQAIGCAAQVFCPPCTTHTVTCGVGILL